MKNIFIGLLFCLLTTSALAANPNFTKFDDLTVEQKDVIFRDLRGHMHTYSLALDMLTIKIPVLLNTCITLKEVSWYPADIFKYNKTSSCYGNKEVEKLFWDLWEKYDPHLPDLEFKNYRDYQNVQHLGFEAYSAKILARYAKLLSTSNLPNRSRKFFENKIKRFFEPTHPHIKEYITFTLYPEAFSRGDGCMLELSVPKDKPYKVTIMDMCD